MTTDVLIETIERAGGVLRLEGDRLRFWIPKDAAHIVDVMRSRKPELIAFLHRRGGRVANFPHCPKCSSYYLYRQNNAGMFECQSCGLADIEEHVARRVQ